LTPGIQVNSQIKIVARDFPDSLFTLRYWFICTISKNIYLWLYEILYLG
jgi:hypothetical protein